jgi:hypothetical protein
VQTLRRASIREPRSGPPIGVAFVGFAVAIFLVASAAAADPKAFDHFDPTTVAHFGTMAATLFAITGATCAYRAFKVGDRSAGVVAFVLLGSAAPWSWLVFVSESARATTIGASAVVLTCAVTGFGLLARSLRSARWLEVFSGLGLVALELSAAMVLAHPAPGRGGLTVVLLAIVGGLACLYGSLVEIEISQHRTLQDLVTLRQQYRAEIEQTEGLLHDLRSGLLSIEAAMGTVDSPVGEPVRVEAARLRQLTASPVVGCYSGESFDLVPAVKNLVALKQASGSYIELDTPHTAMVRGSIPQIMSVVENLLANAERHGQSPTLVRILAIDDAIRLAVSDAGGTLGTTRPEAIFERGHTTHPDGRGIGLHHSRLLAKENDGDLTVEISSEGQPTFVLCLAPARDQAHCVLTRSS